MGEGESSLIGKRFAGRFRIEALLGSGGMGAVYLAHHEVLDKKFAIKVIRKSLVSNLEITARFRREARAASRIEHAHITYIHDFGHTEEGRPYIAMEYVKGPTIDEVLIENGPLPLPRALDILGQIADALAAAHSGDVIHRDLKPKNIVLTRHRDRADFVKILDFGLAKIVGLSLTSGLTRAGETVGTPEYISPELCAGQGSDHRVDIYSFGVMAFEMLVGRVPFGGKVITKVLAAHIHKEPPVPSEVADRMDITPDVDRVILRCLAKNPDDRYPNAKELLFQIQSLQQSVRTVQQEGLEPTRTVLEQQQRRTVEQSAMASTMPPVRAHAVAEDNEFEDKTVSQDSDPFQEATEDDSDGLDDKTVEDGSDSSMEETVKDWRKTGDVELLKHRSRVLEELACAVRDLGIGSPQITRVLSEMLEVENRLIDVESDLALIDANWKEIEARAREREARLRHALSQLEYERVVAAPEGPPSNSGETLLAFGAVEERSQDGWIDARANEITRQIQQISVQMEDDLRALRQDWAQKQNLLVERLLELRGVEEDLASMLRQVRSQAVKMLDPEVVELFAQAGL